MEVLLGLVAPGRLAVGRQRVDDAVGVGRENAPVANRRRCLDVAARRELPTSVARLRVEGVDRVRRAPGVDDAVGDRRRAEDGRCVADRRPRDPPVRRSRAVREVSGVAVVAPERRPVRVRLRRAHRCRRLGRFVGRQFVRRLGVRGRRGSRRVGPLVRPRCCGRSRLVGPTQAAGESEAAAERGQPPAKRAPVHVERTDNRDERSCGNRR